MSVGKSLHLFSTPMPLTWVMANVAPDKLQKKPSPADSVTQRKTANPAAAAVLLDPPPSQGSL
jgi:hypothetical protein